MHFFETYFRDDILPAKVCQKQFRLKSWVILYSNFNYCRFPLPLVVQAILIGT